MSEHVYKICSAFDWERAQREGEFPAVGLDAEDGFVHLSAPDQVRATARTHFGGVEGLVLLTVSAERIEPGRLRWETSRGGASFPHLYGKLRPAHITRVDPMPLGNDGQHELPEAVA